MKKRLIGILLSFALMMVMLPVLGVSQTAYAVSYNLWVGNDEVTTVKTSGEGWIYNAGSNTLTLTNATIENGHSISGESAGIFYNGSGTLNIVLEGTNSIDLSSLSENTYGVYSSIGNINISGDGSLSTAENYEGINAKSITIDGGTINASGTTAGLNTSGEDIKISGGNVTATVTGSNGNAIHSSRHVDIEGGTVTATGGDVAVHASWQVKLAGGSITASGTTRGIDAGASHGVDIDKSVRVWAGNDKDDATDVTQTFVENHNYKWVQTETATLWVGGIPVTSRNASDILGKLDEGVTASYDYDTKTLTLNNYNYESKGYKFGADNNFYAAIYADQDLTIQFVGKNTVKCTETEQEGSVGFGINSNRKALAISGNGTLDANGYGASGAGIFTSDANITINGGTVTASGHNGLSANGGSIIINDGIVTAIGSGDKGISADHVTPDDDMGINAGDSKETAIYVNKDSFDKDHRQNWVQISKAYPLWVRGTLVMDANKGDVLGDGKVSYDPEAGTLKLDGANITADSEHQYKNAAVYYGDNKNELIINAVKASTVTGPESTNISANGISSAGPLTVRGRLTVSGGKGDAGYGVLAPALTVDKNAELTAAGVTGIDILEKGSVAVKGKLTSTGTETGIFIDNGEITVSSGAELNVTGNKVAGIGSTGDSFLVVNECAKVSAVGGELGAIDAIVKNAITGTAWTDKVGTTGETAIEVNADRELGNTYKKVQFPASQYTITYDLSGGTLDGQTGIVTKNVDAGTVITLPAPVRDGYTFDYWEGSKYNAGDKYTVIADHTFKAVWKTADKGGGSDSGDKGGFSKKGVKTGDGNRLGAWIVLLAAALAGTAGMVFARKRKGE